MARVIGAALTLCIVTLFAAYGRAGEVRPKFPPDETLTVPSLTLTDEQFLQGNTANGVAVTLTGQLRFPSWNEHLLKPSFCSMVPMVLPTARQQSDGANFSTEWASPRSALIVSAVEA